MFLYFLKKNIGFVLQINNLVGSLAESYLFGVRLVGNAMSVLVGYI